jgi:preprotein translocase subunit YajC
LKNMFISMVERVGINYVSILRPQNKVKRTLIEFLSAIEKISEKKSLKTLIEQYRCF